MKRLMTDEERAFYRAIGAQIKAARVALGLRQKQVAHALGVTRGHVCNIEVGIYRISLWQLQTLKGIGIMVVPPDQPERICP